ncbi:MAG: SDR family oxidoreductase, partial [Acidobacteria bacterium]|nr:SDR family oxidoreductase [Acidobacteriota bacterium]
MDNGPTCVVAGPLEAINALEEQLKINRCMCIHMNSSHAIHSQMMMPILKAFEESARKIKINKPQIPYISNLTGRWITVEEATNPSYWGRHLGETVQFADGIKELLRKERAVFVEVGPGRDLSALVGRYFHNPSDYQVLNLVKSAEQEINDLYYLLSKIGHLWLYGYHFEWVDFYSHQIRSRISLPTYPFEKQHYWIEGNLQKMMEKSGLVHKFSDIGDWAYLPLWKRSFPETKNKIQSESHYLIFLNNLPFEKKLLEKLLGNNQNVAIVKIGDAFEQFVSETELRTYTINPKEFSHYDILFGQLREIGILPNNILQCWNLTTLTDSVLTRESFDAAQYLGFYSLLYMVKAIEKQNLNNDIHISLLTNHLQEVTGAELLCPEKAPALGLLKSIPQEFPGIICRSIDIILPEPASPREISLIDLLVTEFAAKDEDVTIAFRENQRWVQFFDPFHLEAVGNVPDRSRLRKQGIYLVTGGLGDIGLIISELLVKRVEARVILIGRSTFPGIDEWSQWLQMHAESDPISLKIKKLQRLREMGGKILYLQADVAIEEQMRRVVSQAEATFGKINGVIHAAGITEGDSMRLINQLSDNDCLLQFYPKVYGSMVLEKLFENEKLDFFWLLSSISCILGGLGFGAYAGANFFMDIFAKKYNRLRSSNSSWFSLNWDGMDPEKSAALFERILESEEMDQLVISNNGNLQQRIDQWIKIKSLHGKMNSNNDEKYAQPFKTSPNLTNPYVAPQNPLEQKLVDIFESFFMIKPVGIYDDFFELGGDSLRAVQLTSIIKKLGGGIKISIHEVLLYRNIHDICASLGKKDRIGMMENIVNPPPPASEEKKLALKGEISPEEQRLMEKKLEEIDRLSGLLKENKRTRCYEISPVQASWLIPLHPRIPTNFLYYFYDFSYPVDHEKISDFVKTLTQRNSLLRSVIINEKGNYFIEEFDAFPNIQLPLIDLSAYSDACRETIIDCLISYLNKPMELFDHVLFRPWVLKLDQTQFRLLLQINHLIFDGTSFGILDEQFHALEHGTEGPQNKNTPVTDYYDYVQFMKKQNYDHTGLDQYVNPKDYFHTNNVILKKYEMANTQYESFEVDISGINANFKDYYNEIAFLAFAKLIGDLFGVDK